MMKVRVCLSVVAASLLLASCALIPPISVGQGALGYTSESVTLQMDDPTASGFATLAASGRVEINRTFADVERPSMPIMPTSFRSVQGFAETVTVTGSTPATIEITDASSLSIRVEDTGADAPEPVQVNVPFGPLTLQIDDGTCATSCTYTFADAEAASTAITAEISGAEFRRLLDIITGGDENELTLTLEVVTEQDLNGTMQLRIEVEDNFIRF